MSRLYPNVAYLALAYFHQDWADEAASYDEVLDNFRADEPGEDVAATVAEIDSLLSSSVSEIELKALWIEDSLSAFDPQLNGMGYRDWFVHVRQALVR